MALDPNPYPNPSPNPNPYPHQVDYVRQGALLAASMVLMQNSEHADDSKQAEHRKRLAKVVGDKHEEVMAKF